MFLYESYNSSVLNVTSKWRTSFSLLQAPVPKGLAAKGWMQESRLFKSSSFMCTMLTMCLATNHVLCIYQCNSHIKVFQQHHAPFIPPELGGWKRPDDGSVSVSCCCLWTTILLVLWWIPVLLIVCAKNKCLLGPEKGVDTTSAFVCICGRVSVRPAVMTCSFQCPKLCADCMPYIKTKESTGSFSFFLLVSFLHQYRFVIATVKSEFIKLYFVVE